MDYFQDFRYDQIRVFSQSGRKYGVPVWAFQTNLNLKVNTEGIDPDVINAFKTWAETKKFPLNCSFELPDGVYSSFLFKLSEDLEKLFGIDNSFYQYKGKNPASNMRLPGENCPFDEVVPVPKQEMEGACDLGMGIKAEFSSLSGSITEVGMRRQNIGRLENFEFNFPKFLYN